MVQCFGLAFGWFQHVVVAQLLSELGYLCGMFGVVVYLCSLVAATPATAPNVWLPQPKTLKMTRVAYIVASLIMIAIGIASGISQDQKNYDRVWAFTAALYILYAISCLFVAAGFWLFGRQMVRVAEASLQDEFMAGYQESKKGSKQHSKPADELTANGRRSNQVASYASNKSTHRQMRQAVVKVCIVYAEVRRYLEDQEATPTVPPAGAGVRMSSALGARGTGQLSTAVHPPVAPVHSMAASIIASKAASGRLTAACFIKPSASTAFHALSRYRKQAAAASFHTRVLNVAKPNFVLLGTRSYSAAVAEQIPVEAPSPSIELPAVENIRNLAIIAHVDHGKTTLVDQLLRQSGAASMESGTRVMDSNDLERERGITILSKSTGVSYDGYRINIVDTPGHADFGGEVERVLSMVDGVCLVVCATEGPMTQTKFVLSKALEKNLKPIVVMNKADRSTARPDDVENELLELFISLDATEEQLEYPILYASAKDGWATTELNGPRDSFLPLLDNIIRQVPAPTVNREAPFSMLVTQLESDPYVGKCYMGKIQSGVLRVGDKIRSLDTEGKVVVEGRCTKIFIRRGLEQIPVEVAGAGDIVTIAGIEGAYVNHTICDPAVTESLPFTSVDPPTISMMFYVNDSPLGGKEGKYVTSQVLRDRLLKEIETNVALQVVELGDAFEVKGRGELQMGVLIETMRREGFELSVSPPRVIYKTEGEGKEKVVLEPVEEVTIDVDHDMAGAVIEKITKRKGEMKTYTESGDKARLIFHVPTRGLLGYPAEFKNDTHGQGTINYMLLGYEPYKGPLEKTRKGSIICTATGDATAYALRDVEPRGKLFISPGTKCYPGMIVGEHNREHDLEVNPCKAKQLTNIRAAGKEEAIRLTPVTDMGLEKMIAYIQDDEVIEITPTTIRTRKKELDANKRKAMKRNNRQDFGNI
ncbi:hypothetical protein HDU85_002952 [Gaertneriomyces sp. JEL0708]|nr:hypothetical protein HDU85_002952 [Gaertneriomyces sp. JEL0708]